MCRRDLELGEFGEETQVLGTTHRQQVVCGAPVNEVRTLERVSAISVNFFL